MRLLSRAATVLVLAIMSIGLSYAQSGHCRAIVCDAQGRAHSILCDGVKKDILYQVWEEGQWGAPQIIQHRAYPFNPSLAVDDKGVLHLVFSDAVAQDNADVFYASCQDGVWSEPINLSEAPDMDYGPRVAVTAGCVHVVWQTGLGGFGPNGHYMDAVGQGLQYCALSEGEWSETEPFLEGSIGFAYLAPDGKGGLYLCCTCAQGQVSTVGYRHYADGEWAAASYIPGLGGVSTVEPARLAVDGTGDLHVVFAVDGWRASGYCRQQGGTWGEAQQVGAKMSGGDAVLLPAPDGVLHAVLPFPAQFGASCYMQFKDGTWTAPVRLDLQVGRNMAGAVDAKGTVHIVRGATWTMLHVYYKDGEWCKTD